MEIQFSQKKTKKQKHLVVKECLLGLMWLIPLEGLADMNNSKAFFLTQVWHIRGLPSSITAALKMDQNGSWKVLITEIDAMHFLFYFYFFYSEGGQTRGLEPPFYLHFGCCWEKKFYALIKIVLYNKWSQNIPNMEIKFLSQG